MTYVVIADDGNVSFGFKDKKAEKECDATPQSFEAEASAMKRAKELARSSPGEVIGVYKLVKTTLCRIAEPEVVDQR